MVPTLNPTVSPSSSPSTIPSLNPSMAPTNLPSLNPTQSPSYRPSYNPSNNPSKNPSSNQSSNPSHEPTAPLMNPTSEPSMDLITYTYTSNVSYDYNNTLIENKDTANNNKKQDDWIFIWIIIGISICILIISLCAIVELYIFCKNKYQGKVASKISFPTQSQLRFGWKQDTDAHGIDTQNDNFNNNHNNSNNDNNNNNNNSVLQLGEIAMKTRKHTSESNEGCSNSKHVHKNKNDDDDNNNINNNYNKDDISSGKTSNLMRISTISSNYSHNLYHNEYNHDNYNCNQNEQNTKYKSDSLYANSLIRGKKNNSKIDQTKGVEIEWGKSPVVSRNASLINNDNDNDNDDDDGHRNSGTSSNSEDLFEPMQLDKQQTIGTDHDYDNNMNNSQNDNANYNYSQSNEDGTIGMYKSTSRGTVTGKRNKRSKSTRTRTNRGGSTTKGY